jgi:serine/threonine protein kinase
VYTRIAGCTGTSPVLWYGKEGLYEVIVLEYLGNSLGDLINEKKFNSGGAFLCASQMVCSCYLFKKAVLLTALAHVQLSAVESLHARHFIHRDIKPSNFMAQADGVSPTISLIDFGLARLFRNPSTYLHIPYTMGHLAVGTLSFTSVNGQQGYAQSRRDDLESLAYTIIYLVRGDLPWTRLSAHRDHKAVLCKKTQITVEELCEGLPTPFCEFVIHVRSLGFDQKPDYQRLHSILLQCSGTGIDQPGKAPLFSALPPVGVNCTSFPSDPV